MSLNDGTLNQSIIQQVCRIPVRVGELSLLVPGTRTRSPVINLFVFELFSHQTTNKQQRNERSSKFQPKKKLQKHSEKRTKK